MTEHEHDHEHGRVEDDEGGADFSRLVDEIAGIVALVERCEPGQRRAVFDAYVTAVTEFGASAADLARVELPAADDDEIESEPEPALETAPDPAPVRAPAKSRTAPRGARTSANQGRSGYDARGGAGATGPAAAAIGDATADATGAEDAAPRIRRRRNRD